MADLTTGLHAAVRHRRHGGCRSARLYAARLQLHAGGLGLTGAVAWVTANTPLIKFSTIRLQTANGIAMQPNILGWVAVFAPLAMVLFLSFRIQKMSFAAAQTTFWAYAAVMGVSLSTICSSIPAPASR